MAKKRDIIIGVIIVTVLIGAFGLFGVMFVGIMTAEGDFEISGLGGNVGVVEIYGVMDESMGRMAIENLERWADNNSIKAIVIHVNSGGGGAAISQEIYDAILRARDEKPVVASMDVLAASAAYQIGVAANEIYAKPASIIGNVGVIMGQPSPEVLSERFITTGPFKSTGGTATTYLQKLDLQN